MTQAELDRLVAQIGEEILARVGRVPAAASAKKGEGLNLPDQVCPGCVQRCAADLRAQYEGDHRGGRRPRLGQRAAHQDRSGHRAR